MKKFYPLLALLLLAVIAGIYGLNYYRDLRTYQRAETAHLLARCVNQGLLSLFALQANDWRERPNYYREQEKKLSSAAAALPEKLLSGAPFAEWQAATEVCERLTKNSNRQHQTIFRPLARIGGKRMSNFDTLKNPAAMSLRSRNIYRAKIAAQAAERYMEDLRTDITSLLENSGLSPEARAQAQLQIDSEVLSLYHSGGFSLRAATRYLDRMERFYQLLADNPKAYTLRGGSLYFHDLKLRNEIEPLNRAIVQGEASFYSNWRQIVRR